MTEPAGRLVPLHPEPEASEDSWDAFWASVHPPKTTTIRGVEVLVPRDLTIGYREEIRADLATNGEQAYARRAAELFRAPDGTEIPDLWQQWKRAGMEITELETVMAWGLSRAAGVQMTFAQAHQRMQDVIEGKLAEASTKTSSSDATGAPSRPASGRRTGSSRKTSRT